MTIEEDIALIEELLERGRLRKVQEIVSRYSWKGKTYLEMTEEVKYDAGNIKDVGCELWRSLSRALREKVTKNNLHGVLQRTAQRQNNTTTSSTLNHQPSDFHADWGDAPDVPVFFGRTEELETLENWIIRDRTRCVAIVGMRGVGKTHLSMKLGLGGIGKTDLSLQLAKGIQEEFEFVIWRSLLNAPPESIKLQPNRPTRVWIISRHEGEAVQVLETDSFLLCLPPRQCFFIKIRTIL